MAVTHGKAAKIYADGFDVSSFLSSVSLNGTADIAETSVFGSTSKQYVLGLQDNTLSVEGFYTSPDGEAVALLNAALGSATKSNWLVFPQGDTLGLDGWGFLASQTSINVNTNMGGAAMISGDAQSSVGAELLISHHALGAETTAGNSASVDGVAVSTATGGVGYIHATAFTGTSITVAIQDSADNVSFVDRLVFTAISAANAKERKVTAPLATILRYTRAAWTGTFSNAVFVVGFGRRPKN